eukprot:GDKJ01004390.1.p1 GENE.GDKJ01004390.1~~GDKJ01004390.1.p1  ORF type:complete len:401 (-),score=98.82 GDKJ01004390.1:104-1306(-)
MNRFAVLAASAALALGASASNSDITELYEQLIREHNLELTPAEREFHFKQFEASLESGLLMGSKDLLTESFLDSRPAVTEAFANKIAKDASFTVDTSFFRNQTIKQARKKMGTHIQSSEPIHIEGDASLPTSFSAISKWGSDCPSIDTARDQGNCGSCWAMAGAAVFNDRLCIASKGAFKNLLSTNLILACSMRNGCNGGQMVTPFTYIQREGIVTGGEHTEPEFDGQTCQPYEFHRCAHHMPDSFNVLPACSVSDVHPESHGSYTPKCSRTCTDPNYPVTFNKDIKKARNIQNARRTDDIKRAIMEGGPVAGAFYVYNDFLLYKDGIYRANSRSGYLGGHAIKVIGWGVENGIEYWEIMNSWNEHWGYGGKFKAEISSFGLRDVYYSDVVLDKDDVIRM